MNVNEKREDNNGSLALFKQENYLIIYLLRRINEFESLLLTYE